MKQALSLLAAMVGLVLLLVLAGCCYSVQQTDYVIITQFGKVIGEPIDKPGLHFKVPFIQTVNRIEKRLLSWEGRPIEIPTRDKAYISVDTFARWRITDPKQYFLRLRDLQTATSRLEDILGSETRNAIARNDLIEIVRTDKARVPVIDEALKAAVDEAVKAAGGANQAEAGQSKFGTLPPIQVGRVKIEQEIKEGATGKLAELGIELLDVRFKRINYNDDVLVRVYQRMISERLQIAERFRSEGEAAAARINGNRERDIFEIESGAYKTVQETKGAADAEASRIYADAYGANPTAPEFYQFLKSLETFRSAIGKDTTLLLSTDSDLFRLLKVTKAAPQAKAPAAP